MPDSTRLQTACRELAQRLEGQPSAAELKSVYMDLSHLQGQIQGALHDALRAGGMTPQVRAAEQSFEQFKRTLRQVGFDIRLASPSALQVGMQTALDHALQTLTYLEDEPV
jgi:protein involved in temperature-dependent protein secretion